MACGPGAAPRTGRVVILSAVSDDRRTSETVEWLCGFGSRRTGTDSERRAANGLAAKLRGELGGAAVEPIHVHPQWQLVHLLHVLLALAGSLIAPTSPPTGFALVLAAAASLYLDMTGRRYLLRRLFFRRASQNVVAPPIGPEPADRVLLCAHYDSGLTGAIYNAWVQGLWERARRLWPVATSPPAVLFWSVALLLPPLGARLAGLEDGWISLAQFPQTLVLVGAAFFLGEIALSPPSPGANSNAAGVAAALAAARELRSNPPAHLEVHVVLLAAGESTSQGAREFFRGHGKGLEPHRTWVIDLRGTGRGSPRWVTREIPALAQPLNGELGELCAALADGGGASRLDPGPPGAAGLAASRRYPAIALTARERDEYLPPARLQPSDAPELVDGGTIEAVAELAVGLVTLIDRRLGRRTGHSG